LLIIVSPTILEILAMINAAFILKLLQLELLVFRSHTAKDMIQGIYILQQIFKSMLNQQELFYQLIL